MNDYDTCSNYNMRSALQYSKKNRNYNLGNTLIKIEVNLFQKKGSVLDRFDRGRSMRKDLDE